MIQNIVFDMGNVLLTYDPVAMVGSMPIQEKHKQLIVENMFWAPEWVKQDENSITEREFLELVKGRLPAEAHRDAEIVYERWHRYMWPVEGMLQLEKELRAAGYKLYLLSNAGLRFNDYAPQVPELAFLDGIFYSANYFCKKPETIIYEKFLSVFGLRPETCIFIDDVLENVEGARRVGMEAVQFDGDVRALRQSLSEYGVRVSLAAENRG